MLLKLLDSLQLKWGRLTGMKVMNYISLPPGVMSVNRVFSQIGASSVVPGNIFNIKYQIFLNDIYSMTHGQILHYFMTSQYLETLDWVTNNNNSRRSSLE